MSGSNSLFFDKFGQNERSGVGGRQLGGLLTSPNSSVHHGGGLSPNSSQRNNQNEPATPNPIPSYDYEASTNQYSPHTTTNRSTSPILESTNSFTQHRHQNLHPHMAMNPVPMHNIAAEHFQTTNRQYGSSKSKAVVNTEATLFTPNETMEEETPRFYGNTPPGTIVVKKQGEEHGNDHHTQQQQQHLPPQQQQQQQPRRSQYQPPPPRKAPFATDLDLIGGGGNGQSHAAHSKQPHQRSPSPIATVQQGYVRPSNVVMQLQPQHLRAVGPYSLPYHDPGGDNNNNGYHGDSIDEHLSYNSPLRIAVRLELENALRNTRLEGGGGNPPRDNNHEDGHHHHSQQQEQYHHNHRSPHAADFYEIKPNPLHNQRVGAVAATARQNTQVSSPKSKNIPRASISPTYRRNLEPIRSAPVTVSSASALSPPSKPPPQLWTSPATSLPPCPLAPIAMKKEGASPLVTLGGSPHYHQQLPAVQGGQGGGTLRSAVNNSPQKSGHATSLYTSSPSKRLLDSILGPKFEVKVENQRGGSVLKY